MHYIRKKKVGKKFYLLKKYRKKKESQKAATMKTNGKSNSRRIARLLPLSISINFFSSSWQLDIQSESVGQVGILSGKRRGLPRSTRGQFRIKPFVRKGCLQPGLLQSREEIEFVGWDLVTFGGWKMQEIAFTFKLAPPMRMFSILSFEINFSRGPNYESLINC